MENDVAKKHPIGVIPQYIWLEKRIVDIQRAIREYTEMGIFEPTIKWAVELKDVLFIRDSVEMPAGKKETKESPENVSQQLKAEITALERDLGDVYAFGVSLDRLNNIRSKMRQLSAV